MTGYLGLDIGDKRIGIACSRSGVIASALENYNRATLEQDAQHILHLARQNGCETIVAGLPRHLNGDPHLQAEKNEELCGALRSLGLPVEYYDERLTSKVAERVLISADVSRKKRKTALDKLAAVLILQDYLDYKKNKGANI